MGALKTHRMVPLLIGMLALPSGAHAQSPRANPDPCWGPDKALHFGASATIAASGYAVGTAAFDGFLGPTALGAGLALGAGFGKETLDAAGLGHPSWKDLTWDVLGVVAGLGISLAIHLVVHESSAPAAAR